MRNPRISIVIPTLNEEKNIGRILSQLDVDMFREKYQYEIIVADCHSTDKTVQIVSQFDVKIVFTSPGVTPNAAQARIAGAKQAIGQILIFLDADGIIENLALLLSSAMAISAGKYGCFNCSVNIHPKEAIWKDRIFQFLTNMFVRCITWFGMGNGRGQCMGIRRDIYESIGGFSPDLDVSEDFELFVRARKYTKVRHFPKVLIYESPRRYRLKGYLRTLYGWVHNSFSVIVRKKSATPWERVGE